MGLGATLQEARRAKDISLDSLQEITKIQKRYLVAIEEENFKVLPGKFYARAFIKEYAIAVGLDANEILEQFQESIPVPEEDNGTQYTRMQRSRKDSSSGKSNAIFSLIPTVTVALLVIGIVFAAWFFYQKAVSNKSSDPVENGNENEIIYNADDNDDSSATNDVDEDDETENNNDEDEDANESGTEATELNLIEEGTGTVPESTFELTNPGEALNVKLEVEDTTWLEIKDEKDEVIYSGSFSNDDSPMEFDMTDAERIFLNVGNAPSLTVLINETELEYPVDPNERVHQKIWINVNAETE